MVTVDRDRFDAEALARLFHETYERLAPEFAYRTRQASAKPWDQVPEDNRRLMIATAGEVLDTLDAASLLTVTRISLAGERRSSWREPSSDR